MTSEETRNLYNLEVQEITLVNRADGVPANPEAKVEIYKTNSLTNLFKSFVNGLSNLKKSDKFTEEQKEQIKKNTIEVLAEQIEKTITSEDDSGKISINKENKDMVVGKEDVQVLTDAFSKALSPLTEKITKLEKAYDEFTSAGKKEEEQKQEVEKIKKAVTELFPNLDVIAKSLTEQKTEETKTEKVEKTESTLQDAPKQETKLDLIKKQLEKRQNDVLSSDEKLTEITKQLEDYKQEKLSSDSEFVKLRKQLEVEASTEKEIQATGIEKTNEALAEITNVLKALSIRQDNIENEINAQASLSKSSRYVKPVEKASYNDMDSFVGFLTGEE